VQRLPRSLFDLQTFPSAHHLQRVTRFRRLGGVDSLLECFASPAKGVQQASSFAMSQAAFDFEVRREMRAKDGIRPLAKLLQSDDAKVVEQAMMAVANLALDVPTKQAIAVLGGMGFCAGLLSSSDVPVQANACLAGQLANALPHGPPARAYAALQLAASFTTSTLPASSTTRTALPCSPKFCRRMLPRRISGKQRWQPARQRVTAAAPRASTSQMRISASA
jgi:hypothetical protein